MAQLRSLEAWLSDGASRLVTIGPGSAEMAATFRDEHALVWPVLTDPSGAVFRAAGMRRGLRSLLRLRAVGNGLRALRGGHRQSAVRGDPWQQGGALIFGANGDLAYEARDLGVGDLLDLDALRRVLSELGAA